MKFDAIFPDLVLSTISARIALLHRAKKLFNTIQPDAYASSERSWQAWFYMIIACKMRQLAHIERPLPEK